MSRAEALLQAPGTTQGVHFVETGIKKIMLRAMDHMSAGLVALAVIHCAPIFAQAVAQSPGTSSTTDNSSTSDNPQSPDSLQSAAAWPMEAVHLRDGRVLRGLVETDDPQHLRMLEVHRPAGRPMFAVGLSVPRASVARVERLSGNELTELQSRVRQFRNRANVDGAQLAELKLTEQRRRNWRVWQYEGQWFRLDCTADEATTRRMVLQLERVFAAYRLVMPPKIEPAEPLRVVLFGSSEEYQAMLAAQGVRLKNPAFYSPQDNAVFAGLDLDLYRAEVERVRRKHDSLREQIKQAREELQAALAEQSQKLRQMGVAPAQLATLNRQLRAKFDQQTAKLQRELDTLDRSNHALLASLEQETLAMLAHEAFHAYLENYVYPSDRFDIPRWLNEGLAQVFENGQFELGTLRIDAPAAEPLAELKADLKNSEPLSLRRLLRADHREFLVAHQSDEDVSRRSYLYSWGLAHYLAVQRTAMSQPTWATFVAAENAQLDPIERFEKLVGEPLEKFETKWHQYIQESRPARSK